jgi:hypothetical protein
MSTYSLYLPKREEESINKKIKELAFKRHTSISQVITDIVKEYLDIHKEQLDNFHVNASWIDEFRGCWKGKESAQSIINFIESSRTKTKKLSI